MKKILMIEDESDQIKMIRFRLEASGYQFLSAPDAISGIKIAQQEKPDLILMDMLLPGMNGIEAAGELKKDVRTKNIPVIAVTAVGTSDVEEKCIQSGMVGFIRKPYDSKDLLDKIKKQLGGS